MIDITLKVGKDNKVWEWINSESDSKVALMKQGHIGTHLDTYEKTEVPLEYFKTSCKIIDCTGYDFDEEIGLEVIEGIEINKKDFIIFKTGIQDTYEYASEGYIKNHHQLSFELMRFLFDKKVALIGLDAAGVRRGKEHKLADIEAEKNKTYIIENLNLKNVVNLDKEFKAYTAWIDNPFATGLGAKVILEEV